VGGLPRLLALSEDTTARAPRCARDDAKEGPAAVPHGRSGALCVSGGRGAHLSAGRGEAGRGEAGRPLGWLTGGGQHLLPCAGAVVRLVRPRRREHGVLDLLVRRGRR
jgi:hypothetical protein